MPYETITYGVDGAGVARITFDRPDKLNAWNHGMGAEVLDALESAAADPAARVVVVTGAGRAFSSGADLSSQFPTTLEGKPDLGQSLQQIYNPLILALRRIPKPVIAAVNGPAAGYSVSFACACDFIVAAESSYFLLAFVRIGIIPDGGATLLLPARVGYARATQFAMLGDRLPARTAHEWGMVNEVVGDDALPEATEALAARLAAGPVGAYATMKGLFNRQYLADLEGQLGAEAAAQFQRGLSAEAREGISAFVEKRPADFAAAAR